MAASDEEQGGSESASRFDLSGAFLDKATEGGEPRASANHDHGDTLNVEGWVKCLVTLSDGHMDTVFLVEFREEVAGDANVAFATAGERFLV